MAQKHAKKIGKTWTSEMERAPLDLCIDPQFKMLKPYFKQIVISKKSDSIYEETPAGVFLDLYGKMLPPKVEAWSLGAARPNFYFKPIKLAKEKS